MEMKKQNIIGFLAVLAIVLVGWAIYQTLLNTMLRNVNTSCESVVADLQNKLQISTLEQKALQAYIQAAPDSLEHYCTEIRVLANGASLLCDDLELRMKEVAGEAQNWTIERMRLQQESNQWEQQAIAHKRNLLERDSVIAQQRAQIITLTNKNQLLGESFGELSANLEIQKADTLTFLVSTGNRIRYMGQIRSGKANGTGSGFWPTGGYYHGEWRNNQRHGQGLYIWKEGHRYIGQFNNDQREGEGTYLWTNGERYVGQWKNNQRSGNGILYGSDGAIKFSGRWVDDKPQGK
jgi:hypothetical protein